MTESKKPAASTLYGGTRTRRVTVRDIQAAKQAGERWAMLTAYDYSTAYVFDRAGIPVLLVGDSAANVIYGYDTTVPVSVDELVPLVRGVVRGASKALVVADLPFGSYQAGPDQALMTSSRFMKEGGAQAVKLEGGARVTPQVEVLVAAGIPVMAHIGLTPQSVNVLGGYRVQGRGEEGAHRLLQDAKALEHAGAFAVVLEVVPSDLAAKITSELTIPTIGIGAGPGCDAQVLVWQDMAGLRTGGAAAKFVKQYAEVGDILEEAAGQFARDVRDGVYPDEAHSYN
jgi:3-methyl-2-oxobutanoate hydroxymethyltransferase